MRGKRLVSGARKADGALLLWCVQELKKLLYSRFGQSINLEDS